MVDTDIKKAINIITKRANGTNMSEYCKLYFNTTENLKKYMTYFNFNCNNSLLPTSSGDHHIEAILNGATNITSFDINKLAKYFTELKFDAIKNFTKEEFIRFMYKQPLNKEMFNYIKNSLNDEVRMFWEEILKYENYYDLFRSVSIRQKDGSIINGNNFYEYSANNFISYLEDNNYNIVQSKLINTKIDYIDSNLLELSQKLNSKYDLIILSNIYEYINDIIFDDSAKEFAETTRHLINDNLNIGGEIVIDYLYKRGITDFKKNKDKSMFYAYLLKVLHYTNFRNFSLNSYVEEKTINKLNDFRAFQFLRFLNDLDIECHEIEGSNVACRYKMNSDTDMILVYKKSKFKQN